MLCNHLFRAMGIHTLHNVIKIIFTEQRQKKIAQVYERERESVCESKKTMRLTTYLVNTIISNECDK